MSRHPSQRLRSPSSFFSSVIHVGGLCSFAWSFQFLAYSLNPVNQSYGWHFQYLTIIALALATATFTFGLLADMTGSQRWFRYKNTLSVCSAPLELLVTFLYFGIKSIDRRLVDPGFAPLSHVADAGFHVVPTVVLIIDHLLLSPPWNIRVASSMIISCIFALLYWIWVEHCHRQNGYYAYPLLEALSTPWRVVLFSVSATLMTVNTMLLKSLHRRMNGFRR